MVAVESILSEVLQASLLNHLICQKSPANLNTVPDLVLGLILDATQLAIMDNRLWEGYNDPRVAGRSYLSEAMRAGPHFLPASTRIREAFDEIGSKPPTELLTTKETLVSCS